MAVKKIVMRPEGTNDYADELHPRTSADVVMGQVLLGTTSGTNTYTLTAPTVTALYAGLRVTAKFATANTAASTLNINGLGAKSIVKAGGGALSSGNLKAGGVYTLVYDGTSFQLQGEGAGGTAVASDLLSGKTAVSDAGELIGTIPSKGAATITPSTVNQTIAAGQYLSGIQTIAGDADLVATNIVSGVDIFGVTGSAKKINGLFYPLIGEIKLSKSCYNNFANTNSLVLTNTSLNYKFPSSNVYDNNSFFTFVSNDPIDLTNVTYINFHGRTYVQNTSTNYKFLAFLMSTKLPYSSVGSYLTYRSNFLNIIEIAQMGSSGTLVPADFRCTMDVSAFTGEYYIYCGKTYCTSSVYDFSIDSILLY